MGVLDPRMVWILISESDLCWSQVITRRQNLHGKKKKNPHFRFSANGSICVWYLYASRHVSNKYMPLAIQSTWLGYAANTNCSCAVSGFFTLEGHWTVCVILSPQQSHSSDFL